VAATAASGAAATAGLSAGVAGAIGGAAGGAVGGVTAQAVSDFSEVLGTRTKSLSQVEAGDYLKAAALGAAIGAPLGAAQGLAAAPKATTIVESAPPKGTQLELPFDPPLQLKPAGRVQIPAGGIAGGSAAAAEAAGQLRLNFEPAPVPGQPNFIGPITPEFNIAPHGQQPRPSRPFASHHGIQQKDLQTNVPGYDPAADPTIMLDDTPGGAHRTITGEQATQRAQVRRQTGSSYGTDYGSKRAAAIEQMRRNGVPEAKIGQWLLEHEGYMFEIDRH
jgi:HNH/Endo VII superfamily toxin with a SHH signature